MSLGFRSSTERTNRTNWINVDSLLSVTIRSSVKSPHHFHYKISLADVQFLFKHQYWQTETSLLPAHNKCYLSANPQSFTPAIIELNCGFQGALQQLSNSQQLCNLCYFANSEPYELFWIAEHYSLETDLTADGDKWAWLNSPSPAEETERLARAQGSGRCREGHTQWRGDLPNEQTCLRFKIMLPDTDSSMGTTGSRDIFVQSASLCDLDLQDSCIQVTRTT